MSNTPQYKKLQINKSSRVLFIYPHPDDETYCNGGLIQRLVKNRIDLRISCLTKGEASTLSFSVSPTQSLSNVRQKEFESVMNYLNVTNFEIGDLSDGKLNIDEFGTREAIQKEIDSYKPDIVVTYEPSGMYGHQDHIIVSKIVTEICIEKGIQIIYSTVGKGNKVLSTSNMKSKYGEVYPIEPSHMYKLSLGEYIKKLRCLRLYKSQVSIRQDFTHKLYHAFKMLNEYYYLRLN